MKLVNELYQMARKNVGHRADRLKNILDGLDSKMYTMAGQGKRIMRFNHFCPEVELEPLIAFAKSREVELKSVDGTHILIFDSNSTLLNRALENKRSPDFQQLETEMRVVAGRGFLSQYRAIDNNFEELNQYATYRKFPWKVRDDGFYFYWGATDLSKICSDNFTIGVRHCLHQLYMLPDLLRDRALSGFMRTMITHPSFELDSLTVGRVCMELYGLSYSQSGHFFTFNWEHGDVSR